MTRSGGPADRAADAVRRPVDRRTADVAATTLSAILGAPSTAYDVDVVTAVD